LRKHHDARAMLLEDIAAVSAALRGGPESRMTALAGA
jgi:hypothetical protein